MFQQLPPAESFVDIDYQHLSDEFVGFWAWPYAFVLFSLQKGRTHNFSNHLGAGVRLEGALAEKHLEEDYTHRPDVCFEAVVLSFQDFRGHGCHCAQTCVS